MTSSHVTAKLANQRKPQRYHVSPMSDGQIMVQSAKSIGTFDFRTRQGILNTRGCYFIHLHPSLGARRHEFPADFVAECLAECPALDSISTLHVSEGLIVHVENTVQVI